MADKKNLCAMIPADLHARVRQEQERSGQTLSEYVEQLMVLHRARTMSASYNHFTCRTYKKDGESCTGHCAFWMRWCWRICGG